MLPSTSWITFIVLFSLFTCEIGTEIQSTPRYVLIQKIFIMQNNMLQRGDLKQHVLVILHYLVLLEVGK